MTTGGHLSPCADYWQDAKKGCRQFNRRNNSCRKWCCRSNGSFSCFLRRTQNLYFMSKPDQFKGCWCQRNCRLLAWMKPQTKHTATRPLCKQISLCSWAKGLKIPQTGYEACCWGWRTPTSDKRMCSINATVARQWGRKRGSDRRVCLCGRALIVYGCDLADKRLNLSGTGYPHGTSVCQ